MSEYFERLDVESGNFVEAYETEEQALEDFRRVCNENGPEELVGLALFRFEDDRPSLAASDDDLIKRVQAINPKRTHRAVETV